MGVDYTAHYGIGFKININPEEIESEMNMDLDSYLSEILPYNTSYFEVGFSNYGGEDNEYYVVINDGINNGWDNAMNQCKELKIKLEEEGLINATDEPNVVGGLEIW